MATESDQIQPKPNPRPLGLCGSIVKPTPSSFYLLFSMMCEGSICLEIISAIHLKESWNCFSGFFNSQPNYENNCVLDFKAIPLGRLQY
jgi:hypothetical protein